MIFIILGVSNFNTTFGLLKFLPNTKTAPVTNSTAKIIIIIFAEFFILNIFSQLFFKFFLFNFSFFTAIAFSAASNFVPVKLARHLEFIYPVPMPLILLASPHFLTRSIARLVAIITRHYSKRTIGKNFPRPPVLFARLPSFLPACFSERIFSDGGGASNWAVGGVS